jgi:uncharacterized protein (DUF4415 family)
MFDAISSAVHTKPAPAAAPAQRAVKRKTRITIYLDDEVLEEFRSLSEQCGKGYQTLINAALRTRLGAPQSAE